MAIVYVLGKLEAVVKKILQAVVAFLFAAMTMLVFAQVFTRFCTNAALTWSEELSRFMLVWLIYMASVLAYSEKIHIAVDALTMHLKDGLEKTIQLVNRVCILAFAIFITMGAIEFIPTTAFQQSPANGIVMAYVYFAIPVSMTFMALTTTREIFEILFGIEQETKGPEAIL